MLGSFSEYQRRASFVDRSQNVGTDQVVSRVVTPQSFVQPMKFGARIRIGRLDRAKTSRTDKDVVLERPRSGLAFRVNAMANRAALHENDRVMAVPPRHCCRESEYVARLARRATSSKLGAER